MIVSWMTTNKCNLKCVHCYQDAEEATDRELSTEEAMKMIDEIAHAGFKIMIFRRRTAASPRYLRFGGACGIARFASCFRDQRHADHL